MTAGRAARGVSRWVEASEETRVGRAIRSEDAVGGGDGAGSGVTVGIGVGEGEAASRSAPTTAPSDLPRSRPP